jgi:ligand-binding sensor domain-containing protein
MKTDPEGKIWLASKNGVYRQSGDTFELITNLREAFDLDFFNGELVVAHSRGLSFYDRETGMIRRTLCKDTICWLCTTIGSRLICGGTECCVIIENNRRRTVKLGPARNMPWACTADSTGAVVLGTEKGLYKIDENSKKAFCIGYYKKCIKSVLYDRKGRLWVGTYY